MIIWIYKIIWISSGILHDYLDYGTKISKTEFSFSFLLSLYIFIHVLGKPLWDGECSGYTKPSPGDAIRWTPAKETRFIKSTKTLV